MVENIIKNYAMLKFTFEFGISNFLSKNLGPDNGASCWSQQYMMHMM